MVIPAFSESPVNGITRAFPNAKVTYAVGARLTGDVPAIESKYFFFPNDTTGANGLRAEYFDNMELRGEPKLRRIDRNIEFRWGGEKPAEGFGKDKFSVRWTGILRPELSGTYEITAASDDGIRLFIDGKVIIEHWSDHAVEARMATVALEAGRSYDFKVEFYENGGDAVALVGWTKPDENILTAALDAARRSEHVILFLGNSQYQESEGFDRPSIDLPVKQQDLITAIAEVNPNIIVILNAGAQVNVSPWINSVRALVWAFFPGQEGTQAITDIITGVRNPSGKLPFTIARQWEDYPAFGNFPGNNSTVEYKEGLMVGYRHFDTKKVEPMYPFGFGLSYTTFTMSNISVRTKKQGVYEVSVDVKNIGSTAGAEVVQLYVKDSKPKVIRPEKELKAFARVGLAAGEQKTIVMKLDKSAFEYYDDGKNMWSRSKGGYQIFVGTSSRNVPLEARIK